MNAIRGTTADLVSPHTAAPVPGRPAKRFPRGVRRAVNSGHVVFSVGLLGVEIVMIMLGVIAKNTGDDTLRHAVYTLIRYVAYSAGIPLAVLGAVSGVVLCLRTPWGLWQQTWIKVKIVLTVAVIAIGAGTMGVLTREMSARSVPGTEHAGLYTLQWLQIAAATAQFTMLAVCVFLSIHKPNRRRSARTAAAR
ncbi:hypothetical protein [Yinghuangia seranimata]|uniref:hypothetical protein n=1 Tax=Yinghuangia seranimata TaxID=408067 RepID=UPI00248BCAD5|nr:hypothetical protein [Yinghuangia seranimata]MDI2132060.1 hypothetical protein [Yinghuangia seranimata]